MPNHVSNRLEIRCEDKVAMDKIKELIFKKVRKNKVAFTMEKMLPRPKSRSNQSQFDDYWYYWNISVWGTKWDVYDVDISENSDNSIIIYYTTAWSINYLWIETLCNFINNWIRSKTTLWDLEITILYRCYCYYSDFGGSLEWSPGMKVDIKRYDFMDYCELYMRETYNELLGIEKEDNATNGFVGSFSLYF